MLIRLIAIIALFFSTLAPAIAAAQDTSYSGFLQRLARANRMQPMQNPEYTKGSDVFGWRILDRTNKVVGEVDDVVLGANGSITSVAVDFNRLRLGKAYLNYGKMRLRPASNGYKMSFNDEQIENLYPTLLSDIETASGPDDENFSAAQIVGARVRSEDGRNLGTVEDILFSGNGTRATALYVGMSYKMHRGRAVAVPFDLVSYEARRGLTVRLANDQADALIDFLDEDD